MTRRVYILLLLIGCARSAPTTHYYQLVAPASGATPDQTGSAILAVEALGQVDASVSVLLDVQNTLVNNTLLRAGNEEQKARFLAVSAPHSGDWLLALPLASCGLRLDNEAAKHSEWQFRFAFGSVWVLLTLASVVQNSTLEDCTPSCARKRHAE